MLERLWAGLLGGDNGGYRFVVVHFQLLHVQQIAAVELAVEADWAMLLLLVHTRWVFMLRLGLLLACC